MYIIARVGRKPRENNSVACEKYREARAGRVPQVETRIPGRDDQSTPLKREKEGRTAGGSKQIHWETPERGKIYERRFRKLETRL